MHVTCINISELDEGIYPNFFLHDRYFQLIHICNLLSHNLHPRSREGFLFFSFKFLKVFQTNKGSGNIFFFLLTIVEKCYWIFFLFFSKWAMG